jgi:hypothetical protein
LGRKVIIDVLWRWKLKIECSHNTIFPSKHIYRNDDCIVLALLLLIFSTSKQQSGPHAWRPDFRRRPELLQIPRIAMRAKSPPPVPNASLAWREMPIQMYLVSGIGSFHRHAELKGCETGKEFAYPIFPRNFSYGIFKFFGSNLLATRETALRHLPGIMWLNSLAIPQNWPEITAQRPKSAFHTQKHWNPSEWGKTLLADVYNKPLEEKNPIWPICRTRAVWDCREIPQELSLSSGVMAHKSYAIVGCHGSQIPLYRATDQSDRSVSHYNRQEMKIYDQRPPCIQRVW